MLSASIIISCSGGGGKGRSGKPGIKGELIPRGSAKTFVAERPYGMVAIPGGSFVMGMADQDFGDTPEKAMPKTVTVSSFFMDETEITNAEYREFINGVRDSIVRGLLAEAAGDGGGDAGNGQSIADYAYAAKKTGDEATPYQKYMESQGDRGDSSGYDESKKLDWKVPIQYKTSAYPDEKYAEVLESIYVPKDKRINNERITDWDKIKYSYQWEDIASAVKDKDRGTKYLKQESIKVYPDTTVWVKDFEYAYNDPLFEQYFWHSAYREYPVVGVTWDQARAFCDFRTKMKTDFNSSLKKKREKAMRFRLPTEAEWEYAARGGLENAAYPWGGPYLQDDRGCYLANFKPKRGNYMEYEQSKKGPGSYTYTAPVRKFPKNGYGLYDMAGNVSEWTESPYNNTASEFSSTLNPFISNQAYTEIKKTVKGGSWKDAGYMLMVGYRDWERKDSARSYIGFRTIQDIPEGSAKIRRTTR